MAYTYDATDLATPLNHLRFLVQDTLDEGHFLEDEEIVFANDQEKNVYRTAAGLCRAIAAKLSKTPDLDNVTVKFDAGDRAATYLKLAATYEAKAAEYEDALNVGGSGTLNLPTFSDDSRAFTRDMNFSH